MAGAFKARSRQVVSRKAASYTRASGARGRVVAAQRGYLRTGGYYGRFQRRIKAFGGELKFFDTIRATAAVANTGVVDANLNIIPQGVLENNRLGRQCKIKRINIRGSIVLPGGTTAATSSDQIRVLLVQDKQANGAVFTVLNVLETNGTNSHFNLENEHRFKILYDKNYTLSSAGGTNSGAILYGQVTKDLRINMACNIPIDFDNSAGTGAITTQRTNSLAFLMITDNGVATVSYVSRLRFSDN